MLNAVIKKWGAVMKTSCLLAIIQCCNKTKKDMQEDKVNLVKNVTEFSARCGQDLMPAPFPFLFTLMYVTNIQCVLKVATSKKKLFSCSSFYIFVFSQRATLLSHAVSIGIFHFEIDRPYALVKEIKFVRDLDFF